MIDLELIAVPAFAIDVGQDGVFRYRAVNTLNEAWSGVTTAFIAGKTAHDMFDAASANRLIGYYRTCVEQRQSVEYEVSATFVSGRSWWKATLAPLLGPSGEVTMILGTCAVPRSEQPAGLTAEVANIRLNLALRALKGADWSYDIQAKVYQASPNIALLMGEDRPRPVSWDEWAGRVFVEDLENASCNVLLSGEAAEQVVRFRFRGRNDETRWAQCRRLVTTEGRLTPVICGVVTDVTEERQREMNLEAEARRDGLTGLLNRRGFKLEFEQLGRPTAEPVAILMLDLDGFKQINDKLGHAIGDAVLVEVGRRLRATLGEAAVLARFGGDEFVAALTVAEEADAEALKTLLSKALSQPYRTGILECPMGGSIGLSWHAERTPLTLMLAEADDRLYREKRLRKRLAQEAGLGETKQINLFAA